MIKYITILLLATAVLLASWDYGDNRPLSIDEDDTVAKVLEMLGEDMSSKKPSKAIEGVSATAGEQLSIEKHITMETMRKNMANL